MSFLNCGTRGSPRACPSPTLCHASVGRLGLLRTGSLLAAAVGEVVVVGAASLATLLWIAGAQFEIPYLLGVEGLPHPVVVLMLAEEMPDDHRQLASDGDGGDVVATLGPNPVVEGAQRSWTAHGLPSCLHQQVAGVRPATLVIRP